MRNSGQVKRILVLLSAISVAFVSCNEEVQNGTKTVALDDPNVDASVKSALENGSVSEVVVRKDLLLFPVNAPNLVIAHSQQIHAVPQNNGSNTTDGKPTAAEVAEVNEYSLSQVISTNDTDNNNETESENISNAASSFSRDAQNDSILEPGKLLEIFSGFNLSDGLATEKVAIPDEVQNLSLPKHSIVDLLSKPLEPTDAPITTTASYGIFKRSIEPDDDDDDNDSDSVDDDDGSSKNSTTADDDKDSKNSTKVQKRSVDSNEDDDDDDSNSKSTEDVDAKVTITTSSSTVKADSDSSNKKIGKRSTNSGENGDDDDDNYNRTEYYDHEE